MKNLFKQKSNGAYWIFEKTIKHEFKEYNIFGLSGVLLISLEGRSKLDFPMAIFKSIKVFKYTICNGNI